MKPEELRIGNWVNVPHGDVQIKEFVTGGAHFHDGNGGNFRSLHPIPITTEWLEGLGFRDPDKNGMRYRINVNSQDELCWYRQDNSLRYQTQGSGFTRDFGIKYVHQLQNLYFALTGKELMTK